MFGWKLAVDCLNGPQLYRKPRQPYDPNILERYCGYIIEAIDICWRFFLYVSVFWSAWRIVRYATLGLVPKLILGVGLIFGKSSLDKGIVFVLALVHGYAYFRFVWFLIVGIIYGGAHVGRVVGRAIKHEYRTFLKILDAASGIGMDNTDKLAAAAVWSNLRQYDFEFQYWPVNYRWRDKEPRRVVKDYTPPPDVGFVKNQILEVMSFIAGHTIALPLAYPGSVRLYQLILPLRQGRADLVEKMNGQRFKLETCTGNEIDSMFVDRRGNIGEVKKGNILIVACQGNGGFYEMKRATVTPLDAGYSVFMWNHPGFACSGRDPTPNEEAAAIDVVMQFALDVLEWSEKDIIIYGWSIGGYTASWAAMNYRNIRGLILDATFDDFLPLALHALKPLWRPFVERTVRRYVNLDIQMQLAQYAGPVLLIRRLRDEVMAVAEGAFDLTEFDIDKPTMRRVNRANHLLKNLLRNRYPILFTDDVVKKAVDDWLASDNAERAEMYSKCSMVDQDCRAMLAEYLRNQQQNGGDEKAIFPCRLGSDMKPDSRQKVVLFIASKYLIDVDATHSVHLPLEFFRNPIHPWE